MADAFEKSSRPDSGLAGRPTQETGVPAPTEVPGAPNANVNALYSAATTSPLLGRRSSVTDASQEGASARARDVATEAFTSKAFIDKKVADETRILRERVTELEKETQALRDEKQVLEKRLVDAEGEDAAATRAECESLKAKLAEKDKELSDEKTRYKEKSKAYLSLERENMKLKSQVKSLEMEKAKLTKEVQDLKGRVGELERVCNGLRRDQEQLRQQHEAHQLTAGMVACEAERAVMMYVWRDCDKGDYRIKDYNKLRRFINKLTDDDGEFVVNEFDPFDHGLCDAEDAKDKFARPEMRDTRCDIRGRLTLVEGEFQLLASDILDAKNEDQKFSRLSVETTREGMMSVDDVEKLSERYAQRGSQGDREMQDILLRLKDAFTTYMGCD